MELEDYIIGAAKEIVEREEANDMAKLQALHIIKDIARDRGDK